MNLVVIVIWIVVILGLLNVVVLGKEVYFLFVNVDYLIMVYWGDIYFYICNLLDVYFFGMIGLDVEVVYWFV